MADSKIMALTTGDASDRAVIAHASDIVRMSHGQLLVVYVIEVDRSLPVDAEIKDAVQQGEEALEEAERTARLNRNSFDTQLLQAREIGPAVIHESVIRDIDAIVIGTSYSGGPGSYTLGRDVNYVLEHSASRVILVREPPHSGGQPGKTGGSPSNGAHS